MKKESNDNMPMPVVLLLAKLTIVMGAAVLLSNILAAKIWGFSFLGMTFTFDGGLILFPVTFLLGDMITEIYGLKTSNRIDWYMAFVSVVAFPILWLADLLPTYAGIRNIEFSELFDASFMVIIGSSVSFLLSRLTNNWLFARFRRTRQEKFRKRALRSSFWSRLLDTLVFNFIAFGGRFTDFELIRHMVCAFGIGMLIEWLLCRFVTERIVARAKIKYNYEDGHST